MEVVSQYITSDEFQAIVDELNITGLTDETGQGVIDRAEGDLETALCERYEIPLIAASGGAYENAPKFSQQKVKNAMIAKVRSIFGKDKDRNIVVEATQRYIDLHAQDFERHVKDLLNDKKDFQFKLNSYSEGSYNPTQAVGLARKEYHHHRHGCGNDDPDCF